MKAKIDKLIGSRFGKIADSFFNSVFYILAIGIVCIISHSFNIPVVGAALLTVLLVPSLLFCKNSFVLAPFLMMCSFVMSKETMPNSGYYNTPGRIAALIVSLVLIVSALVFNLIYYGKYRIIFKRAYLTVSLCLVSAALLLGGIGAPSFSVGGVVTALSIAASMFIPYSFLVNAGEYRGRKTVEYFAWATIMTTLVIGAAMLQKIVNSDLGLKEVHSEFYFGYAGPNTSAAFMLFSIPMTFYLVYKYKHGYLFMLLVAAELLLILITYSRASTLVAVSGSVVVAIGMCFKKKRGRIGYLICFGIILAALLALILVFREQIAEKIKDIAQNGINDSGRMNLWKFGIDEWKSYPIFGTGLGYLSTHPRYDSAWQCSYHCTPITYLIASGVIGLLAYIYHRYKTVRLTFSAKMHSERAFVALTVLAMLLNALLDIAMTSPQHLLFYAIMIALIECDVKYQKSVEASKSAQLESVSDMPNTSATVDNETEKSAPKEGIQ